MATTLPYTHTLDALDLQRLGVLLLACADMSTHRYVLLRYSATEQEWRVSVNSHGMSHTAASQESALLAMDRACQWLRAAHPQRVG